MSQLFTQQFKIIQCIGKGNSVLDSVEQGSSQVNSCHGKRMKTDFNSDGNPGIIDTGYNLRLTSAGRSEGAISFDQTRGFQTLQLLGYRW